MPVPDSSIAAFQIFESNNQQKDGETDENALGITYFEGLPEGTTLMQVQRCVFLLEHVLGCRSQYGVCPQGEGCLRTRQVLIHYLSCRAGARDCSVCLQLAALCRIHSDKCQAVEGSCLVPYCMRNGEKVFSEEEEIQPNLPIRERTVRQGRGKVKKRLSQLKALTIRQQKLQIVKRLLDTNRQATAHVVRTMLRRRPNNSLSLVLNKMKNLSIKEIKTTNNPRTCVLNTHIQRPLSSTTNLKLDIGFRLTNNEVVEGNKNSLISIF